MFTALAKGGVTVLVVSVHIHTAVRTGDKTERVSTSIDSPLVDGGDVPVSDQ